jgi:S1-C subfamily serine protease
VKKKERTVEEILEELGLELTIYSMEQYSLLKTFLFSSFILISGLFLFSCETIEQGIYNYSYPFAVKEEPNYNESIAFAKIFFFDEKKERYGAQGTAFAVDENYLLTAGHFCKVTEKENIEFVELTKISKTGGFLLESEVKAIVVKIDEEKDVCLLRSDGHGFVPLKLEPNINLLQAGDRVYTVGCPSGLPFVKEHGTVMFVDKEDKELVLNLRISKGNSGSPVIRNGKVFGMVYAYWNKEQHRNVSFAVSSEFLFNFLIDKSEGIEIELE